MGAYRTLFRGLFAYYDMSTVTALPYLDTRLAENFLCLNIFEQCTIALFVTLFDDCNTTEFCCEFRESFCFGSLGKTLVHVGPFVVFTSGSCSEIFGCSTNALKFLEPEFGVFFFVVGSLEEECRDLFKTFFLGL